MSHSRFDSSRCVCCSVRTERLFSLESGLPSCSTTLATPNLGCYSGKVDTPNTVCLAEVGVCFESLNDSAHCCPSRAAGGAGAHAKEGSLGPIAPFAPEVAGRLRVRVRFDYAKSGQGASWVTKRWDNKFLVPITPRLLVILDEIWRRGRDSNPR